MNILISINNNFTNCTICMLDSLMMYNNIPLNVYLIYQDLDEKNIYEIRKIVEGNNGKLFLYKFSFEDNNFNINIKHITKETYFRLYAPFILPENIDRILYLDGDIICFGSLEELYNINFDENIICAVENVDPDPIFIPWINNRLGRLENSQYFNAGVLLINLKKYREFTSADEINEFIEKNKNVIWCQDQDVINKMFDGKIKAIDDTYNYQINHISSEKIEYNKILIHYLSPPKPWKEDYYLPFHGIPYYKYLIGKGEIEKADILLKKHISNANLSIVLIKKLLDKIFD